MHHSQKDINKEQYKPIDLDDDVDSSEHKNSQLTIFDRLYQLYFIIKKIEWSVKCQNFRQKSVSLIKSNITYALFIFLVLALFAISFSILHFRQPQPPLQLTQFCIVTPKATGPSLAFQKLFRSLNLQTYSNWTVILSYMPQEESKRNIWSKNLDNKKVKLFRSTVNRGNDIYLTLTNHCPKHSVAIILNLNENLHSSDTLKQLSLKFNNPNVGAIFLPYIRNKNLKNTTRKQIMSISRQQVFPFNKQPSQDKMKQLSEYSEFLKVFKTSIFCKISIYDLINFENEQFYESSISYLLPIVQMLNQTIKETDKGTKITIKNQDSQMFNSKLKIAFEDLPLYQIQQYSNSQDHDHQVSSIGLLNKYSNLTDIQKKSMQIYGRIPDFLQQNRTEFKSYGKIPLQQIIIPLKIHFIELQTNLTLAKQSIIKQTQTAFKNHQIRVWRSNDISPQVLPVTLNFKKKIQTSGLTNTEIQYWISTIMMIEILSKEGGYYFDSNYQAIKDLTKFRQFILVGTVENPWQLGQSISCKFLGVLKGSKQMLKLLQDYQLFKLINQKIKQKNYACDRFLATAYNIRDYSYIKILPSTLFLSFSAESQDKRMSQPVCAKKQQQIDKEAKLQQVEKIICKNNYGIHHQYLLG